MIAPKFIEIDKGNYFEYHLPCHEGLLEKSLFNHPFHPFPLEGELLNEWLQYLWDLGIANVGTDENSLLYALIVELLSTINEVNIITFGNDTSIKEYLVPLVSTQIEWKYSFEFTINDQKRCRQYGYQTPIEFLNQMNYFNKDLSNRGFLLSKLELTQINTYIKAFNPEVSSWSSFINTDWNSLTSILQNKNHRPASNQLLQYADCIVHIQIGGDEGYLDYVIIQSKEKLGQKISMIEYPVFQFGKAYENLISELGHIDEEWKIDAFKEFMTKRTNY